MAIRNTRDRLQQLSNNFCLRNRPPHTLRTARLQGTVPSSMHQPRTVTLDRMASALVQCSRKRNRADRRLRLVRFLRSAVRLLRLRRVRACLVLALVTRRSSNQLCSSRDRPPPFRNRSRSHSNSIPRPFSNRLCSSKRLLPTRR